ncbi:MAG: 5'-methylthioadenosine/adenosylhomocysteine nucleosidase [Bacteroidaceae bacterium]|nr:5'-methylthioadenosine/adenosylhomocysteine nucleosidase [Bacteroidaceae bacterium]
MKIGIIVAMQDELACVEGMLENKNSIVAESGSTFIMGHAGKHEIILTQSGIGKVNAAIRTFELIDKYHPDIVINSGVAGGIDKETRIMDMVVGTDVVYHDVWCGEGNEYGQVQGLPDRFAGNKELIEKVLKANQGKRVYGGLICSGDKFITDREELENIKNRFPDGMACDMESGAIAQVCHICKVPFISMRIISDTPGVEGHWEQYTNFWEAAPKESFAILRNTIENL